MREPEVAVRTAVIDDAPLLAAILDGGALTNKEDPANIGAYREALAEILATPGNTVLVAEVEGKVAGMCQLIYFRHLQQQGGRCAEIESMHVEEGRRGLGIGGFLLEAAVEQARRDGCYRVQLTSNQTRPDAHRFYLDHGFTGSHTGFKRLL